MFSTRFASDRGGVGGIARFLGTVLFAAGLAAAMPSTAGAQPILVIAGSGIQLSGDEVADVFLGEKQFAGPVRLVPIDNGPLQEAFVSRVLHMDTVKYNGRWARKSFREGLNPPSVKSGDAEVAEYVKRNPGAIGYVGAAPAGVTVIQRY